MDHSDYRYIDFRFKSIHERHIIAYSKIPEAIAKAEGDSCYMSWYRFPQSVKDAGTAKDYKGSCICDFIPFDFDNKADPSLALEEARKFVTNLEVTFEIKPEALSFYFSGKKGVHVLIPSVLFGGFKPSPVLPDVVKKTAKDLIGDLDADMLIYDRQRVLRAENSRHKDSQLYRIALLPSEFLHGKFSDFQELAKNPRQIEREQIDTPSPALIEIYQKHLHSVTNKPEKKMVGTSEIFRGGLAEGDGRNNAAFRLIRELNDKKVPAGTTIQILRLWDSTNTPQLMETDGTDVLEKMIGNIYGESESGAGITADMIKDPVELAQDYTEYIEHLKLRKVLLGYFLLDKKLRGLTPGELMFIIAKASVGKSALIQNIQKNLSAQHQATLFVSLEQPLPQCFERMMQMTSRMSGNEVEESWSQDIDQRPILINALQTQMPNAYTIGVGMGVSDIEDAVRLTEERSGRTLSCVLVDYLGYLDMPPGKIYEQVSQTARDLKKVAKKIDRAIICAGQVNREKGEDGTKPLTLGSGRDSGAIEESADSLLGIHHTEAPEEDSEVIYQTVQILKNRKGKTGSIKMMMDRKTLQWTELFHGKEF